MHARGQVAAGDGLQQAGGLRQAVVGGLHHRVEVVHHLPEIMLEALLVAALAEIAGGGGAAEAADLAADGGEVALDGGHGLGDLGLFAGQRRHVAGQVAHGIALGQLDHLHLDPDVVADQLVGAGDHHPVVAGERGLVHAVADDAGVVLAAHFLLRGDHRLQLRLHALHRGQQLADFVAARGIDAAVELAGGDIVGHAHRFAQRLGDRADDGPAQQGGQQQRQRHAGGHRHQRTLVGLPGRGHIPGQLLLVVLGHLLELVEQQAALLARFVRGDAPRGVEIVGGDGRGNALVRGEVRRTVLLEFLVHRQFFRRVVGADVVVGLLGGLDQAAGVGQALVVVGQLLGVALVAELRLLIGTEFAQLRAHFAQLLHRRHPVVVDLLDLGVGEHHPPQREAPHQQGDHAGDAEGEGKFPRDRKVLEPFHRRYLQ